MLHKCCNFGFLNQDGFENTPIFMKECGIESQTEISYDFDNRKRTNPHGYLLQYTLEGCGTIEFEGKEILLPAESGFLIPLPHESRYYLPKMKTSFWHLFYVIIEGDFCHTLAQKLAYPVFSASLDSDPIQLFLHESNGLVSGKKYQRYENSDFIYHFLLELLREIELPKKLSTPAVDRALHWIQTNYKTNQNISNLCNDIGISLSHLSRQFHIAHGLSPSEYMTSLRLEHAISLLRNSSLTIQEIALQSGFSCGNYFAKVFQKKMNQSPSDYRSFL